MKIDENSVKINEIDDDDDDCGGDGGSSSILYLKTPDQPPLAATMLIILVLVHRPVRVSRCGGTLVLGFEILRFYWQFSDFFPGTSDFVGKFQIL